MFQFAVGVCSLSKAEQCTGTKSTTQYVPLSVPLPALKIVTGVFLNCERTKNEKRETVT
jgi:hypothetical protein